MATQAIDLAARQIGLNETDKAAVLREYMSNGGERLDPAVTAWCAAFVNATLKQSGQEGTGALNARSFLDWGQGVDQPQRGDVAVFSRGDPNGWQGHVGFFDGYNDDGSIRVLGGNQGDQVSIANYDANRLLGFRRSEVAQPTPTPVVQNELSVQQPQQQQPFQLTGNQLDPAAFMSKRRFGNALG